MSKENFLCCIDQGKRNSRKSEERDRKGERYLMSREKNKKKEVMRIVPKKKEKIMIMSIPLIK